MMYKVSICLRLLWTHHILTNTEINAGYDAQFNSVEPFWYHFGHISESTLQTETTDGQLKEISYFY